MSDDKKINNLVLELLDLTNLDSPYAPNLVNQHRRKLVHKLLENGRIDQETADYLMN